MSEPMKVHITGDFADILVRVPLMYADQVKGVLENILALIAAEHENYGAEEKISTVEEVFPEGIASGEVLRGLRYREGMTQAELAALVGVKPAHISDMERGRRPIGREMAKRLGKALQTGYKIFL